MRYVRSTTSVIAACLVLGWVASAMAQPFSSLGRICINLAPFIDFLRLDVRQPNPQEMFFVLGVDWDGIDDAYHLLGGGTAYGNAPTNTIGLQLVARNPSPDFFSGLPICTLQATIDPATTSGPFTFDCQSPEQPFVNGGQLVPVPCDQGGPVAQALMSEGRARAGDRH